MELAEEKRLARGEAAKRRTSAHREMHATAKRALAERGLPLSGKAEQGIVSGFFPYKSEISTLPLLQKLAGEGWTIAMPVVVGPGLPLIFRAWRTGEATVTGIWDIPVPAETSRELVPDVLLVPLLAFDRQGYRLGYGGGFYDRTLIKLRALKAITAIGVGYSAQEVAEIPHGTMDQKLDYVMTEIETFKCG